MSVKKQSIIINENNGNKFDHYDELIGRNRLINQSMKVPTNPKRKYSKNSDLEQVEKNEENSLQGFDKLTKSDVVTENMMDPKQTHDLTPPSAGGEFLMPVSQASQEPQPSSCFMNNLANASFGKPKIGSGAFSEAVTMDEFNHIMQSLKDFENEKENKVEEKVQVYDLGTFRIPNGIKKSNEVLYEDYPPSDFDLCSSNNNYE